MKQGNPPEPVIAYDHTGAENTAKDPMYRMAGRILLIVECTILAIVVIAMINLY